MPNNSYISKPRSEKFKNSISSEKKVNSSFKFQRENKMLENQKMDWDTFPGINTFIWNSFSREDCQISQSYILNLLWDYYVLFFCKEKDSFFPNSQVNWLLFKVVFQVKKRSIKQSQQFALPELCCFCCHCKQHGLSL